MDQSFVLVLHTPAHTSTKNMIFSPHITPKQQNQPHQKITSFFLLFRPRGENLLVQRRQCVGMDPHASRVSSFFFRLPPRLSLPPSPFRICLLPLSPNSVDAWVRSVNCCFHFFLLSPSSFHFPHLQNRFHLSRSPSFPQP